MSITVANLATHIKDLECRAALMTAGAGANAITDQVIDTDNSFTAGQTLTLTTAKVTPIAALVATVTITFTRT